MWTNVNKFLRLSRFHQGNKVFGLISALSAPTALFLAALSWKLTIVIFSAIGLLFLYMKYVPAQRENSLSLVFIAWLCSSILSLMIIFHVFVVDLLEILVEENLVLLAFTVGSIACLFSTKQKANQIVQYSRNSPNNDIEATLNDKQQLTTGNSNVFCFLCQAYVSNQGTHCVWLDCCIGRTNKKLYSLGIFLGMIALFYGSNLTLTTVCHPFILYRSILLPDDCSDVYYQYNIAVCFVSGVYSLLIAVLILLYLTCRTVQYIHRLLIDKESSQYGIPGRLATDFYSFFAN